MTILYAATLQEPVRQYSRAGRLKEEEKSRALAQLRYQVKAGSSLGHDAKNQKAGSRDRAPMTNSA
jgi:hypothetical protein